MLDDQTEVKRGYRKWVIGVLVGAIVVAAAIGIFRISVKPDDSSASCTVKSPEAALVAYLTAVAKAQTKEALALLASPPADRTFITDAVLAESARLAPITNISTESPSVQGLEASAYANYHLGDQPISDYYTLSCINNQWLITKLATINVTSFARSGIGMALGGVALDTLSTTNQYSFLPGAYQLTADNPFLAITNDLVLIGLHSLDMPDPVIRLADGVPAKLSQAAQAMLDGCLGSPDLVPPSQCGNRWPTSFFGSSTTPPIVSLKRTLTSGSLESLNWQLHYDPLTAQATTSLNVDVEIITQTFTYDSTVQLPNVAINLTNPTNLQVSFP